MIRRTKLSLLAIILLTCGLMTPFACGAESKTETLPNFISELAEPYIAKREHCRLTIGVLQNGERYVASFGTDQPPDANTGDDELIYEIGSITKVFTCILLAQCEVDGLLSIDDPIGKHLPDGFTVSPEVAAITFRQLATHTAGLPRLPSNLDPTGKDPYASYGVDELQQCLQTIKLDQPPGTKQAYSNLGLALLGYLVTEKRGQSFEELLQDKICQPLGMNDTTTKLTDAQKPRLVAGHTPDGKVASNWNFGVLAPAGALRSTVGDMLTFSEAQFDGKERPLRKALDLTQKSHYRTKTENTGLAWQIQTDSTIGQTIHWHNGGTGGYHSFLGIDKANRLAVVLITNYADDFAGDDAVDRMGMQILKEAARSHESSTR